MKNQVKGTTSAVIRSKLIRKNFYQIQPLLSKVVEKNLDLLHTWISRHPHGLNFSQILNWAEGRGWTYPYTRQLVDMLLRNKLLRRQGHVFTAVEPPVSDTDQSEPDQ